MANKKNFPLRIEEDIYDSLKKWADDELRSVNSHIEFLLKNALIKHKRIKKGKEE